MSDWQVLYKYSHAEACKRDIATQCVSQFANHMHRFDCKSNAESDSGSAHQEPLPHDLLGGD